MMPKSKNMASSSAWLSMPREAYRADAVNNLRRFTQILWATDQGLLFFKLAKDLGRAYLTVN
jgi:hypothetical protein